jgi:hypothetical protein
MNGAWTGGLIGLVVAILFMLLVQGAKRPVARDPTSGELVLRFNPILTAIMAVIGAVGPVGMVALSFVVKFKTPNERYIPVGIGLFFLLLGGGLAAYFYKTVVRVNHEGLVANGLFGLSRAISWQEVVRARFGTDMTFSLITAAKKKVQVHFFMKGMSEFSKMIEEYLPDEAKEASHADLEKLRVMFGRGR